MATCEYRFARFPSCGIFIPTRTSPVKQRVETTGDCAGEPQERKVKRKKQEHREQVQ